MQEVKKADVQVVTDDFLEKVQGGGNVIDHIRSLNIAPWGSDVSNINRVFKNAWICQTDY